MSWLRDWVLGEWNWLRLGRSALLIYLIIAAYLYFGADALIFHPPPPTYSLSAGFTLIPVGQGDRLAVRYVSNPDAHFTVLFSHGNAEDLGMVEPFLERLRQWGLSSSLEISPRLCNTFQYGKIGEHRRSCFGLGCVDYDATPRGGIGKTRRAATDATTSPSSNPNCSAPKPMHTVAPLPMPVSPVTLRKRTFKVSSRKNQKLLDGVRKAVEEARA